MLNQPQAYQHSASFVPKLATKIVQWLDPQEDDHILDVGCGGKLMPFPHLLVPADQELKMVS